MTRGQKALIAVIIALLLLALALFFLRRPAGFVPADGEQPSATNQPRAGGLGGDSFPSPSFNANVADTSTNTAPQKPDERNNMKRIAAAFAERFGSFSNAGEFENILDLKVYMTPSLQEWADAYVADARLKPRSAEYFGTTTRSISVDLAAFDEAAGTATLVVKTQRRETGSTAGGDKVYYQDLKLEFLKSGETWKVNTVAWVPL